MSETFLKINEIFYSIQGEGSTIGIPSIFIRLAGCNLKCYWCDTPFTWLYSKEIKKLIELKLIKNNIKYDLKNYSKDDESKKISVNEIMKKISEFPAKNIIITGGEPLLQAKNLEKLCELLNKENYNIEMETNGTIKPINGDYEIKYNVSPKLQNSLNEKDVRFKSDILKIYNNHNAIFKFVINDNQDIKEVLDIINQIDINNERVYLMPEGKTKAELQSKYFWLIELCKKYNFKYSHRLHIELYGDKRGV
tara:strand:+ start:1291 stop:2043 length:753 start_codon:yes stop_codon:yes gene_type:complete